MLDGFSALGDDPRMRSRYLILAGAFLLAFAGRGLAQQQLALPPVETVIVTANAGGPVIWHATKNGADVALLAVVEPLPDNFAWNSKRLETLLNDTRRVLLPPQVRMGVLSGAWFYLTESDLLHPPDNKTLGDVLDPHVAAEFAQVCAFLHEPRDRYNDNSPIFAAMRLGSDFRHVDYLTTHEPEDSIAALARTRRIAVRRIATYDLVSSAEEILRLPPAVTGRCIEAAIRDIDFQSRHVRAAANAWATGDVAGMTANWAPSNYYACLEQLSPHATAIDAREIDDTVEAVDAAFADGGHTLVVVEIGALLRKDGVIDRLKAEGVSVALSPEAK